MRNSKFWQVSEVKVTYRNTIQVADRPTVSCSRDAENILRSNWSDDIELLEEFNILFLTKANQVKGIFRLSRGGMAGTVVDIKILFATALKGMAAGLILGHNHPSGRIQPSQADIDLTRRIRKAGETLDLPVLDHLILSPDVGYYSFADEGML
jgi:DNA repair protein RadC